jgi:hypothetical protein
MVFEHSLSSIMVFIKCNEIFFHKWNWAKNSQYTLLQGVVDRCFWKLQSLDRSVVWMNNLLEQILGQCDV